LGQFCSPERLSVPCGVVGVLISLEENGLYHRLGCFLFLVESVLLHLGPSQYLPPPDL
jgi:hypothetical protein